MFGFPRPKDWNRVIMEKEDFEDSPPDSEEKTSSTIIRFPFPTLKRLCILKLGMHLATEKIGPFNGPWPVSKVHWKPIDKEDSFYNFRFREIFDGLPIPTRLKAELCDVLTGLYYQVWKRLKPPHYQALNVNWPKFGELKLAFDAHGNLDKLKIWNSYFVRKVAQAEDKPSLVKLLFLACNQGLFKEIELILHRFLYLADKNTTTQLDGPYENVNLLRFYILEYKFINDVDNTGYKVFSCFDSYRICGIKFTVKENGITITSDMSHSNFQTYMQCINLLPQYQREYILSSIWMVSKTDLILGISTLDDYQTQVYLIKQSLNPYYILERYLMWPFTEFFIPVLQILVPRLTVENYQQLFNDIVQKMPERLQYGVLYSDLLLKFWSILSSDVKKSLKGNVKMDMLLGKNEFAYNIIANEM